MHYRRGFDRHDIESAYFTRLFALYSFHKIPLPYWLDIQLGTFSTITGAFNTLARAACLTMCRWFRFIIARSFCRFQKGVLMLGLLVWLYTYFGLISMLFISFYLAGFASLPCYFYDIARNEAAPPRFITPALSCAAASPQWKEMFSRHCVSRYRMNTAFYASKPLQILISINRDIIAIILILF